MIEYHNVGCETYKKQVDEDTAEKSSKVIDIRKVTAEKKDSIVTEVNHSHYDAFRFFPI